jgi:hypothetical protein
MTQVKNKPDATDDDILPEYDFSKMGKPVRGKYAQRIRENGYSVTVNHEDGTSPQPRTDIIIAPTHFWKTGKLLTTFVKPSEKPLPRFNIDFGEIG